MSITLPPNTINKVFNQRAVDCVGFEAKRVNGKDEPARVRNLTPEASIEVVSHPEDIMRKGGSAAIVVSIAMASMMWVSAPVQADPPPGVYTVEEGNKVDDKTLAGWKTWRAMACERCHGAEQEGLVGPSLVNSLKTLSKADFHTTITNGRPEKGMPNFGGVPLVQKNCENLYNYLKGRSEGRIAPGHLYPMSQADAPAPPAGWNEPN
jgi:cytochrome c553